MLAARQLPNSFAFSFRCFRHHDAGQVFRGSSLQQCGPLAFAASTLRLTIIDTQCM